MTVRDVRQAQIQDGAWVCVHTGPPTRLCVEDARRCPDCGTRWQVWPELRIARAKIDHTPQGGQLGLLRRAPLVEVDQVIDYFKQKLPGLSVIQFDGTWPADDDNVWLFRSPGSPFEVQLDSAENGAPPFVIQTDENELSYVARSASEACEILLRLLKGEAPAE